MPVGLSLLLPSLLRRGPSAAALLPPSSAAMSLVRPAAHDFASPAAWDDAYASAACKDAEWLLSFEQLRALVVGLAGSRREQPALELGCGTSSLAAGLCDQGFTNVTACDASRVAVQYSSHKFAGTEGLRFVREDARCLSFEKASFSLVLDKGTLDAICSGEGYDYEGGRVASELVRVLQPNGLWICVSLMPPSVVLPMMHRLEWGDSLRMLQRIEGHYVYVAELRGLE